MNNRNSGLIKFNRNKIEMQQDMLDNKGFVYCENCGTSKSFKFDCHHLIFRSEKPKHEHLNSKKNLIIVCRKCHENFHNDKGARNQLVEQRELNLLFGDDVLSK